MTANRSRSQVKNAPKLLSEINRHKECPFCSVSSVNENILQETKHFFVICNVLPYDLWDSQKIQSHLMVIPKKHTVKLGNIGSSAAIEYIELVDKYESLGYDIYARSPLSLMKTVEHQHTHLLKPHGKRRRFLFFIRKPYIRWHF